MRHGVFGPHETLLHECLHERVVAGLADQFAPAQQVGTRIAGVREEEGPAFAEPHRGERRRHAGESRIPAHVRAEIPVGLSNAHGESRGIRNPLATGHQAVHESG